MNDYYLSVPTENEMPKMARNSAQILVVENKYLPTMCIIALRVTGMVIDPAIGIASD